MDAPPALAATWDELLVLLRLSPDAVLVLDSDGNVRRANPTAARLFATTAEELQGSPAERWLGTGVPTDAPRSAGTIRADATAAQAGDQARGRRADGTRFPVDVARHRVEVDGEELVLAAVRDLSTHVRSADATSAGGTATLREVISLAAHELRTPLTSMRGFAETLLRDRAGGRLQERELLSRIVRNADRQDALIGDLLDLARLQGDELHFEFSDVDVRDAALAAVDTIADTDVILEIAPRLTVRADQRRLTQVLVNLLTNAVRYGAPPIELTADRATGDEVVISVVDHGEGIPDELTDRLFEPFTQTGRAEQRARGGLGLGLHIASQLAARMGGRLDYDPRDGVGARFVLTLPVADRNGTDRSPDRRDDTGAREDTGGPPGLS